MMICFWPLRSTRTFVRSFPLTAPTTRRTTTTTTTTAAARIQTNYLQASLTRNDYEYLEEAMEYAKVGLGHTYPNPAVGCVLVRKDTNEVIGAGFHPQAGYPHAEVFALLEAAGHVESGVESAKSVVENGGGDDTLQKLSEQYSMEGGPEELFGGAFSDVPVTAYVTLEPCCHYGKTPPCASSLVISNVDRVVVGFRDPNPKVDGGGVSILEDAGIQVDMATGRCNKACSKLVSSFVKRITPREGKEDSADFSWINGAMRSALRRLAGTMKSEDSLQQVNWGGDTATDEDGVDNLTLSPSWLEQLDTLLWEHEIVNLRLNKAVGKKKLAKRLGERVAKELGAHVAQTVGHTSLLYRPGIPPVINLVELEQTLRKEAETKAEAKKARTEQWEREQQNL